MLSPIPPFMDASLKSQLLYQRRHHLLGFGYMLAQIRIVLLGDLLADQPHIRDPAVFRLFDLLVGGLAHDYSSRIKSGVTISGRRRCARAETMVRCVRLFGLARCF